MRRIIGINWSIYGKNTKYFKGKKLYFECKRLCLQNGYTGVEFDKIWYKVLKSYTTPKA